MTDQEKNMDYFKDNIGNLTILDSFENELNIENDYNKVTLHGTTVFTLDSKGCHRLDKLIEELKKIKESIIEKTIPSSSLEETKK